MSLTFTIKLKKPAVEQDIQCDRIEFTHNGDVIFWVGEDPNETIKRVQTNGTFFSVNLVEVPE